MRFELPSRKKWVYETTFPMRWEDMDATSRVNSAAYFQYLGIPRMEWLSSIGVLPDSMDEGPLIVNAFCEFHKTLRFPGTVLAKCYVANPGLASFDTFVTLERTDELGVIYASGGATISWFNICNGQSIPLPTCLLGIIE